MDDWSNRIDTMKHWQRETMHNNKRWVRCAACGWWGYVSPNEHTPTGCVCFTVNTPFRDGGGSVGGSGGGDGGE